MGEITIYASGNKEQIRSVPKDQVRQFSDFLRNRVSLVNNKSQESQPPTLVASSPAPVVSVADELKKFAELRDLGVVSEEEFNAQKSRLLQG